MKERNRPRGVAVQPALQIRNERAENLIELLKAAADPTRLQMLAILRNSAGPVCICDLTALFGLSQPTISHHMARLRRARLAVSSKRGVWSYYSLPPGVASTVDSLLGLLADGRPAGHRRAAG